MLYVTDFHSHLLPCMDDGSRSVEESLKMLAALGEQGVNRVVASPHFYANDESVEDFLARRSAAFESLKPSLVQSLPQVVLGAELRYYQGVSKLKGIEKLCIQGTPLLLLEMPQCPWSGYVQREIESLACTGNIRVLFAHVERCLPYQNAKTVERMTGEGVLMQMNAEAFSGFAQKRKAVSLLKRGLVQFIGSDCHNLADRAPNIKTATDVIEKKFGKAFLADLVSFGNGFFEE